MRKMNPKGGIRWVNSHGISVLYQGLKMLQIGDETKLVLYNYALKSRGAIFVDM